MITALLFLMARQNTSELMNWHTSLQIIEVMFIIFDSIVN